MSMGFLLRMMNIFWLWLCKWLHNPVNILKKTVLCILNGVSCMLYKLYLSKLFCLKKKKRRSRGKRISVSAHKGLTVVKNNLPTVSKQKTRRIIWSNRLQITGQKEKPVRWAPELPCCQGQFPGRGTGGGSKTESSSFPELGGRETGAPWDQRRCNLQARVPKAGTHTGMKLETYRGLCKSWAEYSSGQAWGESLPG